MSGSCCKFAESNLEEQAAGAPTADGARRPPSLSRRGFEAAGFIIPAITLALLPKCPACLAAYIAVGTGLGLSVATAGLLRTILVILCMASLSYFVAKRGRRLIGLVLRERGSLGPEAKRDV